MGLTVKLKQSTPSIITLLPAGEIDSHTSETLDREITRALTEPVKTLVLDMSEVKFISSAGVGTITKAKTSGERKNCGFAMVNLQPQAKKVFEIIRLLPALNIFESTEELDEYLGKIQRRITDGDLKF